MRSQAALRRILRLPHRPRWQPYDRSHGVARAERTQRRPHHQVRPAEPHARYAWRPLTPMLPRWTRSRPTMRVPKANQAASSRSSTLIREGPLVVCSRLCHFPLSAEHPRISCGGGAWPASQRADPVSCIRLLTLQARSFGWPNVIQKRLTSRMMNSRMP